MLSNMKKHRETQHQHVIVVRSAFTFTKTDADIIILELEYRIKIRNNLEDQENVDINLNAGISPHVLMVTQVRIFSFLREHPDHPRVSGTWKSGETIEC